MTQLSDAVAMLIGWKDQPVIQPAIDPTFESELIAPEREPARLTLRVFSLAELLRDPTLTERPQALIPRLAWRGRTTLLSGREKAGKSTLIASLVARKSHGDPIFGEPTRQARTMWVAEEHIGDVARRFADMGADPEWIAVVEAPAEGSSVERVTAIHQAAAAGSYDVIVIDTLATLLAGLRSWDDAAQVATVMMPLVQVARDLDVALVLNAHASKSGNSYRGSTELSARVDVIAEMDEGTEAKPRHRKINVKGRLGMDAFTVVFDGRDFELSTGGELPIEMRVQEFVIQNPGCSQRDILAKVKGERAAEMKSAIDRLVANAKIEKAGKPTRYSFFPAGPRRTRDALWDAPPVMNAEHPDARGTHPDAPWTHPGTHLGQGSASPQQNPKGSAGRNSPQIADQETTEPPEADWQPDEPDWMKP